MEAIFSSETSVITKTTQHHIPEENILDVHRKLKVLCLKNAVFWDVSQCGSCKNGRFGAM
jgi:hypothetical protein